jgi:hypothetical protein
VWSLGGGEESEGDMTRRRTGVSSAVNGSDYTSPLLSLCPLTLQMAQNGGGERGNIGRASLEVREWAPMCGYSSFSDAFPAHQIYSSLSPSLCPLSPLLSSALPIDNNTLTRPSHYQILGLEQSSPALSLLFLLWAGVFLRLTALFVFQLKLSCKYRLVQVDEREMERRASSGSEQMMMKSALVSSDGRGRQGEGEVCVEGGQV